jgi:hypothetical protein
MRHAKLILLTVLLAVVTVAHAAGLARRPILLRIQGHVGAPREGDRKIAELTMRQGERVIDYTVEEIWVLSGDAVGTDVLHEVEQYKPSLTVSGPKEVLGRLTAASPEDPLEIVGYYRRGQRMLMLSSVDRWKKK